MKVVLLHALPLDERMWESQQEALWEHEVVAPNLYELPGSSMDFWAMALLRQVFGEFVLVGASMGGYCALALAGLAPERVQGLVLVGARADPDTPERKEQRMAAIGTVQREGAEGLWRKLEPALVGEAVADDVRAQMLALTLEQPAEGLVNAIRAIRDRGDTTDVVRGLETPVLVEVGDADPLLPVEDARALAKAAPKGKLHVFGGAGHLPSLERPDEFNARLLEFLAKL